MKVGDLVSLWDDGRGPIGVVIWLSLPLVLVLMDEEAEYFADDELWIFYENR